jgi:hypothetical protein
MGVELQIIMIIIIIIPIVTLFQIFSAKKTKLGKEIKYSLLV